MMRYLLPKEGRFYRANLHCHSTQSDGALTPEELVEAYRNAGYSILAITDHMKLVDHQDLCRDDFLLLNGYEFHHAPFGPQGRLVHLGMIATDPTITEQPEIPAFPAGPVGELSPEFAAHVNEAIRIGSEAGFLPIYNHMRWSMETDADAMLYEGLFGMELFNYFSSFLGVEEYNLSPFICKLRKGQKLFGIMADDNHNPIGRPRAGIRHLERLDTSFGGFIDIKATKLTYKTIIDALKAGDFYCSMGPTFEELYIDEDMNLQIRCSTVRDISIVTANRLGYNPDHGQILKGATMPLTGEEGFIVVVLTDEAGRKAVSQPYWL